MLAQVPVVSELSTEVVAQLTGEAGINATLSRWNVAGTDLGHTFEHRGDLYMVFGDTWGRGGTEGSDWRSNTVARIAGGDLSEGLRFTEMIAAPDGQAAELLSSRKVDGVEKTVIPTYGVSVDDRIVLHYMSVRTWGEPGRWDVAFSGLASSEDGGRSWTKIAAAVWPDGSAFAQVAFVVHQDHVYVFGIPEGRFGPASLARVRPGSILDLDAYEYWSGTDWVLADPGAAAAVVPGPVGELSVRYSDHHGRWLMMYLDESRAAVVLRTAEQLAGPWDEPRIVTTAGEHPQLYAPYLLPSVGASDTLYYTMSVFGPYQVLLMRTELPADALVTAAAPKPAVDA